MKCLDVIRQLKVNVADFYLVFSACLGQIYVRQSRIEKELFEGKKFKFDFNKCLLEFEDSNDTYNIQYLGAANNKDDIWAWGWNEKTNFPKELFDFANQIKDFGEVHFAEYAKAPHLKMQAKTFTRDLGSTVCAMFGNYGFCSASNGDSTFCVALTNLPEHIFKQVDSQTFIQITMHSLKNHKVNHRLFVEAFLLANDIKYNYEQESLIAHFDEKLEIKFKKTEKDYDLHSITVIKPKEEDLVS